MAENGNGYLDLGQNYRIDPTQPALPVGGDITIMTDDPDLEPHFDPDSNTTQIPLEDGSVSISMGPPKPKRDKQDEGFNENLAEILSEADMTTIAEKLLLGIESDIQSRASWLENVSNNISLLGLEVKQPRGATASGGTPSEGVSTVDHPLLLEAVLRFQANARGELLPTDGPVKVRNDGQSNSLSDRLAQALEKDLNHYLTKVATEYIPDTDRMLLMLGFCGISFKKGYHDPIKRRPVIKSIDAKDLIVSNAATTLDDTGRVTHSVKMRPSIIKRMQMVKAYRDIPLHQTALPQVPNVVDAKINQVQGILPPSYLDQDDQDRELYECYCEIDLPGYEHKFNGKETGLPLPYKVTIDKESRRILEIRRNWLEEDPLCMARNRIIAYIFIPGFGFYGIGLVNILGNSTKAVTAAWRLLLDAGMFSSFPGFLYVKSLAKQLTNQFRVPPGGGMPIDTVGGDIRQSVMPLPYKDPSTVFIQLIDNVATTAQRVGGTAELQVGEGKQDAPVGTTLALIEQATKLISAVHKRLHQAQGQEFEMLKDLLAEDPEALWRHNRKSQVLQVLEQEYGLTPVAQAMEQSNQEHIQTFLAALENADLTPRADPNTSSQTERYLKVVAMRQMAATNMGLDKNKIDEHALRVIGIDDPERFFVPPQPPTAMPPDPKMVSAQAQIMDAQTRAADSRTKAMESQAKLQQDSVDIATKAKADQTKEDVAKLGVEREAIIHRNDLAMAQKQMALDSQHKNLDRQADLQKTAMTHAHGIALAKMNNSANTAQAHGVAQVNAAKDVGLEHGRQRHEAGIELGKQKHEASMQAKEHTHEKAQAKTQAKAKAAQPKPKAKKKSE